MSTVEDQPSKTVEDDLDAISPRVDHAQWTFSDGTRSETYTQKGLSFISKLRFASLLGGTLDIAMSGPGGLRLDEVMQGLGGQQRASWLAAIGGGDEDEFIDEEDRAARRARAIDAFVQGMSKLVTFAPGFLLDCYCLWLAVPDGDWSWVKTQMAKHEDDGGLSDEQGIVMIETFIDQNSDAVFDFFTKRAPLIARRLERKFSVPSPSQKPSKRSGRRTPQNH